MIVFLLLFCFVFLLTRYILTCRTRLEQKGGVHVKSFGILGRAVEMFIEGFVRRGTTKVGFTHQLLAARGSSGYAI